MKRKSLRKSGKADDEENGVEVDDEHSESEEPASKKGRKSKGRKSKEAKSHESDAEPENNKSRADNENQKTNGEKPSKRKSKGNTPKKKSEKSNIKLVEETDPLGEEEQIDEDYEVEAVLDDKIIRGVKHYLIRWKGYTEESDTWEPEDTLDCQDLLEEYKQKVKKKTPKKKRGRKSSINDSEETWDENEDFEVYRILDVYFHKNGKRDFLVSWKGYPSSQNSWEPEDNMDCKDLIAKYMEKVDRARKFEGYEEKLRVNRRPVNRLEFKMYERGRRLSKRNSGKDRVHYFDGE